MIEATSKQGPNECLFCLSEINSFSSVEHIFPESLGNTEKILPKGVVCDKCNNEILSGLDADLLDFEPIAFFLTLNGIKSKKGKIPRAAMGNMVIENPTGKDVRVKIDSLKKRHFEQTENGFQLHFKGKRKWNERYLRRIARSLYKIVLELIYLDHGYEFAYSDRFDEVRSIVLDKVNFNGYLLIGTNKTSQNPGITYRFLRSNEDGMDFTLFEFNFMFLKIISDLERRETLLDNKTKLIDMTVLKF